MDYKEKVIALLNSQELSKEQKEKLENIFPELKESEDERIRKGLINGFKECLEDCQYPKNAVKYWHDLEVDSILAWLEKQGEKTNPYSGMSFEYNGHIWGMCARDNGVDILLDKQLFKHLDTQGEKMPADKVEPKFKVGDWITNGHYTWKIVEIKPLDYILQSQDGDIADDAISYVDEEFNLWTINDGKEGDVLVCKGNIKDSNGIKYEKICLFNNLGNAFFTLTKTSNYVEEVDIDVNIDYPDNTIPATKRQKEILFMAMKGAGYEYDSRNKKLKKIGIKSENLESKTLDAKKVIEWLKDTINETTENYGVYKETRLTLPYNSIKDLINDFKEDFLC